MTVQQQVITAQQQVITAQQQVRARSKCVHLTVRALLSYLTIVTPNLQKCIYDVIVTVSNEKKRHGSPKRSQPVAKNE
jgi:hypothetical protein